MEFMYSDMCAALGGTNLVHDNAYMGSGLLGSLESILFADDAIGCIKRMEDGITVNDETLCLDLIDKIGPGGEYVSSKHTAMNFKKEAWYPKHLNRKQYQQWTSEGSKDIRAVISEKARTIIESDSKPILDDGVIAEYDRIIKKREQEVKEGKFHREDF